MDFRNSMVQSTVRRYNDKKFKINLVNNIVTNATLANTLFIVLVYVCLYAVAKRIVTSTQIIM